MKNDTIPEISVSLTLVFVLVWRDDATIQVLSTDAGKSLMQACRQMSKSASECPGRLRGYSGRPAEYEPGFFVSLPGDYLLNFFLFIGQRAASMSVGLFFLLFLGLARTGFSSKATL